MRKKILLAAAIILLLLLCFIGFIQYRQYSSYKIPIHAKAQTILKLHTDGLIKIFIKEYGFNFKKKIDSKNTTTKDTVLNNGIYLPGNIFIYNVSSKLPATLFCTISMYNFKDFKVFIQKRFNIALKDSATFSAGISADSTLTIACNTEYVSVAWSPKKEEVLAILKEIITKKNILPQNAPAFIKLKKEKHLVVAVSSELIATVDIEDKKILLQASTATFKKVNIPMDSKKRVMDTKSAAFASISFSPWSSLFKKEYTIKNRRIQTDSILLYFNGYADIEIAQSITQKDTITSYEYDDNFEKKEKQTITTIKVPAIKFLVKAEPGLLNYLQQQDIITADNTLNKEVFPLYNVSVVQANEFLYFNTDFSKTALPQTFASSNNFLDLKIDFKKDTTTFDIPFIQPYIKNISDITLTGKKENGNGIILHAVINFNVPILKELMQMINR